MSAIKTGIESNAILSFANMTTFVMKPESRIVLGVRSHEISQFNHVAGNIWMNVKKMVKDGSMEVKMSQAVAGIKGTTFVLEDTGSESIIKVIEGVVEFRSLTNNSTEMVSSGEMVTATTNGLSPKTTFNISEESKSWDKIVNDSSLDSIKDSSTPQGKSSLWILIIGGATLLAVITMFIFKKKKISSISED